MLLTRANIASEVLYSDKPWIIQVCSKSYSLLIGYIPSILVRFVEKHATESTIEQDFSALAIPKRGECGEFYKLDTSCRV